jgi:two-component system CheB/CheR fusion protein
LSVRESSGGEKPSMPAESEPAVRHLEREMEQMKTRLRDTVEQYEASTEELKASNEELQAMNEELRSATEELETSREELQSINEELTTVNQEMKSKVDELGHANSDLANLMAATAIATIFLDRHLSIMRYTPSAVALFPLIASDIGRPLTDLSHGLRYAELKNDAEQVLQTLIPVKREVADGAGQWFLAQLLPYRTTDDHIAGVVLTFVDITERRQKEEELQRAHQEAETANRTKDQFLATLSHELRTPLTPVLTAAEALLKRQDLPPIVVEGLEMICRNVEMENHFINDLLDITRISRGKLELVCKLIDIHQAIEEAIEISRFDAEAKHQRLRIELKAEQQTVHADFMRTQQVFWNLLKNASKFTPEHGEIRVNSRNEPGWIVVEISDSGMGIDPTALPNIFEAFKQGDTSITSRFGGLGLGLAISKATVDKQGGSITASSPGPGRGATFTVKLPLHELAK